MRTFPAEEALVVAYWRKLVSSIEAEHKSRGRVGRNAALSRKLAGVGAARRAYQLRPRARVHS
jgi:hypothetical protein